MMASDGPIYCLLCFFGLHRGESDGCSPDGREYSLIIKVDRNTEKNG